MPSNHLSKTICEPIEKIDGQHLNGEQITKNDICRIAIAARPSLKEMNFKQTNELRAYGFYLK